MDHTEHKIPKIDSIHLPMVVRSSKLNVIPSLSCHLSSLSPSICSKTCTAKAFSCVSDKLTAHEWRLSRTLMPRAILSLSCFLEVRLISMWENNNDPSEMKIIRTTKRKNNVASLFSAMFRLNRKTTQFYDWRFKASSPLGKIACPDLNYCWKYVCGAGALKSHVNRPTIKLTFIVSVLNKDKLTWLPVGWLATVVHDALTKNSMAYKGQNPRLISQAKLAIISSEGFLGQLEFSVLLAVFTLCDEVFLQTVLNFQSFLTMFTFCDKSKWNQTKWKSKWS